MQKQIAKSERTSGTVGGTVENAEVGPPRADRVAVLMREDAGDLVQVREVVNGPGSEQLRKGDYAEGGMASTAVKVVRLQIEGAQLTKIRGTQGREFVEKLRQGFALALALLRQSIEGRERARLTELQNHFDTGHPVGALAVN